MDLALSELIQRMLPSRLRGVQIVPLRVCRAGPIRQIHVIIWFKSQ